MNRKYQFVHGAQTMCAIMAVAPRYRAVLLVCIPNASVVDYIEEQMFENNLVSKER